MIFEEVDTCEKLYVLGYNAGDYFTNKDPETQGSAIPITFTNDVLNEAAEKIVEPLAAIRSQDFSFPVFTNEAFFWCFLRGYFDAAGEITNTDDGLLECRLRLPDSLWESISKFVTMPGSSYKDMHVWHNNNALDFLERLYRDSNNNTRSKTNYSCFLSWSNHIPSLQVESEPLYCNWAKTLPNAFAPFKERASDSGYDLHLVSIWKKQGNVTFYDTGIAVSPDFGWYFMLVPRSSLSKSGYILANSVGIIDRTYTGSIKVPLIKIDPDAPDIELPFRAVQIIPCPIVHAQMKQVKKEEIANTNRGDGGFGSTNK